MQLRPEWAVFFRVAGVPYIDRNVQGAEFLNVERWVWQVVDWYSYRMIGGALSPACVNWDRVASFMRDTTRVAALRLGAEVRDLNPDDI